MYYREHQRYFRVKVMEWEGGGGGGVGGGEEGGVGLGRSRNG